jgi:hypothetical protein
MAGVGGLELVDANHRGRALAPGCHFMRCVLLLPLARTRCGYHLNRRGELHFLISGIWLLLALSLFNKPRCRCHPSHGWLASHELHLI